jgi:predicted DNA-binding protein
MSTRTTKVYSITMPPEMGKQAEQLAKKESRTMSELMREAFRRYQIEEAERRLLADPMRSKLLAEFRRVLGELRQEAKQTGLDKMTMREIDAEIAAARKSRSKKKGIKQPVR